MLVNPNRYKAAILILVSVAAMAQTEPKKISAADSMAAVKQKVMPEYPPAAKQLKIEGIVMVEALVNESGQVERVDIIKGNPVLTRPAADAVKHWRFAPFQDAGKPCKAVAQLSLTFKL